MKRSLTTMGQLLATIIIFTLGCNKKVSQIADQTTVAKVKSWLDTQISSASLETVPKIRSLGSNLNYNVLRFEKMNDKNQFLVIPINSEYKLETTPSAANVSNSLLLIVNDQGSIESGKIVQYISKDHSDIPANSFNKIYNGEPLAAVSGQIRYLGLNQRVLYGTIYENGIAKSHQIARPKGSVKGVTGGPISTPSTCTDWYLVTYVWRWAFHFQ